MFSRKVAFFFIFLTFCLLHPEKAFSQWQLISQQQEWADAEYADASDFDQSRLLCEASHIISYNLLEESARNVLRLAAEKVPEINDYLDEQARAGSVRLTLTLEALRAIADCADAYSPGSADAVECRLTYLISKGSHYKVDDEFAAFVKAQGKPASKKSERRFAELLCQSKIMQLLSVMYFAEADDPSLYPKIFELEKEVFKLYPLDSEEISMERAEAYFRLATLKSMLINEFVAFINHYKAGKVRGMQYILMGESRDYPNNALQYFDTAYEIAAKALNPGHPMVVEMGYACTTFRLNMLNPDEEVLKGLRDYLNYVKYYYPSGSFELASARINASMYNERLGLVDTEGLFLKDDLKTFVYHLGEDSVSYIYLLANLASMKLYKDPLDTEWTDLYVEAQGKAGNAPDSDVVRMYFADQYASYYDLMGERAAKGLEEITAHYRANHSPTLLSVRMGMALANFYDTRVLNYQTGAELLNLIIADLRTLEKSNPDCRLIRWYVEKELAATEALTDRTKADAIYSSLAARLDKEKFEEKDLVRFYILRDWGDLKNIVYDYAGAKDVFSQCIGLIPESEDDYIECVGLMAQAALRCGTPDSQIDAHVDKALRLIDGIMTSGYCGQINHNSLSCLADYLDACSRTEEAISVVSNQIAMYEKMFVDSDSYNYVELKNALALLYESNQQLNEASRLRAENTEIMRRMSLTAPSTELLSVLWNDYYSGRPRDYENIYLSCQKLVNIFNITNLVFENSGANTQILYSYVVQVLSELLSIYPIYYTMMENFGMDLMRATVPEEQLDAMEELGANINRDYGNLFPTALDVMESFKGYDRNYLSNPYYQSLATSVATCYAQVQKDTVQAMKIREELLEGLTNVTSRFTTTVGVATDYYMIGRNEKSRIYLDRAIAMLPSVPKVESQDFLNIYSLKYQLDAIDGEFEKAAECASKVFAIHKERLDGNFQLMTLKEQYEYLNEVGDPAAPLAAMLEYIPDKISGEVYDAWVYRTGMQLRSQKATKEALRQSDDPRVQVMMDSLAVLNEAIFNADTSVDFINNAAYTEKMMRYYDLRSKANRLEQQLLDMTAHLRKNDIADVRWQQVRDRLEEGDAALEFLFADTKVMALLIRPGMESPQAIGLCDNYDIWEMMHPSEARGSASLAKHLYREGDTRLYEALWEPMEPSLSGVKRVYFSLPGILSSLALNAFATPDGQTLFDRYELVQLTTTAQLVFDHPSKRPETIAMMGDILYSPTQVPLSIEDPGVRDVETDFDIDIDEGTRAVAKNYFRHLPFTAMEIDGIASLFPVEAVDSVRRLNATETRLHEMVASRPDILHLATHGYYVSDDLKLSAHPFFKKAGAGSMQRSGIALSGAENTWKGLSDEPDANDGIVTAAEVAEFDLKGTGLVALSACETALGDTSFEGVFGLQRGFKQAGVQSLLVSLWSVNDNSTSLFMTTFYESLISGKSRQESWRDAVSKVRGSYPEPYHWAPFILLDGV